MTLLFTDSAWVFLRPAEFICVSVVRRSLQFIVFIREDYIIFVIMRIQNKSLIHTADENTRDNDQ